MLEILFNAIVIYVCILAGVIISGTLIAYLAAYYRSEGADYASDVMFKIAEVMMGVWK